MDRFINLLLSLHNPNFHEDIVYSQTKFAEELGLTYNLSDAQKMGREGNLFDLTKDADFMIRYQAVALAKFHNHFGAVDRYMKEFARICMDTHGNEQQRGAAELGAPAEH